MKNLLWLLMIVFIQACTSMKNIEIDGRYKSVDVGSPVLASEHEGLSLDVGQQPVNPNQLGDALAAVEPSRFDIAVENTDLSTFLQGLVIDTPYNIIVHPEVKIQVTLELKQVTVVDVLKIVRDLFGLHLKVDGTFISIMPNTLETQIFTLDYVDLARHGSSDMSVSTGSIKDAGTSSNGSNSNNNNSNNNNNQNNNGQSSGSQSTNVVGSRVTTESSTNLWANIQAVVQSLIGQGQGRMVTVMEQSGVIVVRALRSELKLVGEFLTVSEFSLQRQVILEAKILEVILNDRFESGINWTALGNIGGEKGGSYDFGLSGNRVSNPEGLSGVLSTKVSLRDFGAIIDLLEGQGEVRVLSSPRIATVNNQKAVIKVGTDEFFVTNVSSTTTTGTSTTTTPSVTLTPFFSGIALDVTPQISSEGDVILHIHPTVSEVSDQNKVVTIGGDTVNLPLALSTIRESDSIVKAKNGQVIVIGGLLKNVSRKSSAGVPLLGRLPFIGKGFSQAKQVFQRSELVILVRPVVSDEPAQERDVLDTIERINVLGVR